MAIIMYFKRFTSLYKATLNEPMSCLSIHIDDLFCDNFFFKLLTVRNNDNRPPSLPPASYCQNSWMVNYRKRGDLLC